MVKGNDHLGPIRWGELVDGKFRGLMSDMKICRYVNRTTSCGDQAMEPWVYCQTHICGYTGCPDNISSQQGHDRNYCINHQKEVEASHTFDVGPSALPNKLGERHNQGKVRYDLLPAKALHELVEVYTFGANKYSDRNWEKGLKYMDTVASILRHLWAFVRGETKDEESGCHHMAHAAFGCLALVEFHFTNKGEDDRPYER
jgi:hypothetical protein